MTISLAPTEGQTNSFYFRPTGARSATPKTVLDAAGRWAVLRGAIADTELDTSDDDLRKLLADEATALRFAAALPPRSADELLAKIEIFVAALGDANIARDLSLLGHAIAVDVRNLIATS